MNPAIPEAEAMDIEPSLSWASSRSKSWETCKDDCCRIDKCVCLKGMNWNSSFTLFFYMDDCIRQ